MHLLIFLPCRLEQFLLAVKIRWYYNIGRGPVCSTDEEIATAFEEEHGGIRTAISEGLFPFFLKQDDVGTERDLATVFIEFGAALTSIDSVRFSVTECIKGNDIQEKRSCDSLVGALNGIFANGYTSHEDLDRQNGYVNEATFSRRTHRAEQNTSPTTRIFIPTNNEERKHHNGRRKQLAMYLQNNSQYELITPSQILIKDDPFATTNIIEGHGTHLYLQKHRFITREDGLDEIFVTYFNLLKRKYTDCRVYSRMI